MVGAIQNLFNGEVRLWEIVIASICFSFFFVDVHRFHNKWKLDFKPFSCASCLAAWTALTLMILPESIVHTFFVMFVSGVLVLFLKLILDILWKISK
jgi:hypothetical protein